MLICHGGVLWDGRQVFYTAYILEHPQPGESCADLHRQKTKQHYFADRKVSSVSKIAHFSSLMLYYNRALIFPMLLCRAICIAWTHSWRFAQSWKSHSHMVLLTEPHSDHSFWKIHIVSQDHMEHCMKYSTRLSKKFIFHLDRWQCGGRKVACLSPTQSPLSALLFVLSFSESGVLYWCQPQPLYPQQCCHCHVQYKFWGENMVMVVVREQYFNYYVR